MSKIGLFKIYSLFLYWHTNHNTTLCCIQFRVILKFGKYKNRKTIPGMYKHKEIRDHKLTITNDRKHWMRLRRAFYNHKSYNIIHSEEDIGIFVHQII